jgi:hypothetical protein
VRALSPAEEQRLAVLTASSASTALLELTATGLKKSIMDATAPVRRLLHTASVHDFANQPQGPDNKVMRPAMIHTEHDQFPTQASLYRPHSKEGDPRIWFYRLGQYASPGDILAVIPHGAVLHLLNLSRLDLASLRLRSGHSIAILLTAIAREAGGVADELLVKLKDIASRGPIASIVPGDASTGIGRTLEDCLGIQMNASREPDYRGIELKAYRQRRRSRQVRKNLFAQVPDWSISKLKSSAEILATFGYERDGEFRLYCQVSAATANPQGLRFRLDLADDRLIENSSNPAIGDFVVWQMETLRARLAEKHAATFWVGARSNQVGGREHFHYVEAVYTRAPVVSQFDILLGQGVITMDHLIKRKPSGGAHEKGPLFKLEPHALALLFPPPIVYDLLAA